MSLKQTLILLILLLAAGLPAAPSDESRRLLNEGNNFYIAKDYDKALASYAASLRLDNTNVAAYQSVGNSYSAKRDFTNALKYYGYALQLKPDSARAWQGKGNSLYGLGRKDEAMAAFRKSLELDPSNTALQNFIAAQSPGSAMASAPSTTQRGPSGDWVGAAWRSLILPGWGQAYNGESGKGLLLGGLTLAFVGGEVATYMIGNQAMQDYHSYTDPQADYDGAYRSWETMSGWNHALFIGSTALYSWALVDAIWGSQKPATLGAARQEPPLKIGLTGSGLGAEMALLHF